MDALIATLMTWIVARTGLPLPDAPRVLMIPKDRMVEMAYGPHPPVKSDLRGLYTDADTTIYLLKDWNRHALLERSTLLHELVHHLLSVNKVKLQCAAASERPAYYLQLEWLRDQGVADPYEFLGIDELVIAIVSGCLDVG